MTKQFLYWKPIWEKNVRGEGFLSNVPDIIANDYRGELLANILAMPAKEPISFESAALMASNKSSEAFDAHRMGHEPGECNWYFDHFVEWISSLGYHIELTGDEFELYLRAEKTA
jgi:hypothetical protein